MRTESCLMLLCALHYASAHIVDDINFHKARAGKIRESDNLPSETLVIKSFYIKIDEDGKIAVYEDNVNVAKVQTEETSSTASNKNNETRLSNVTPLITLDHDQYNTVHHAEKVDSERWAGSGHVKVIKHISTSPTLTESGIYAESNAESFKTRSISNATVFGIVELEQRGNANPQKSVNSSSSVNTIFSTSGSESRSADKLIQLPRQYNSENVKPYSAKQFESKNDQNPIITEGFHEQQSKKTVSSLFIGADTNADTGVEIKTNGEAEHKQRESNNLYKSDGSLVLPPTTNKLDDQKRSSEQDGSIGQSYRNESNEAYFINSNNGSVNNVLSMTGTFAKNNALATQHEHAIETINSSSVQDPVVANVSSDLTSIVKPLLLPRGLKACSITRKHIIVRIRDCPDCF